MVSLRLNSTPTGARFGVFTDRDRSRRNLHCWKPVRFGTIVLVSYEIGIIWREENLLVLGLNTGIIEIFSFITECRYRTRNRLHLHLRLYSIRLISKPAVVDYKIKTTPRFVDHILGYSPLDYMTLPFRRDRQFHYNQMVIQCWWLLDLNSNNTWDILLSALIQG